MSDYPEHDKLSAISDQSQVIGEFLEWLSADGVHRMRWDTELTDLRLCPNIDCDGGNLYGDASMPHKLCNGTGFQGHWDDDEWVQDTYSHEAWVPDRRSIQQTLADFFQIDLNKIESEKRQMLEALRA